jgi:NADH-quinone oxidoreductase subunit N
MILGLFLVVCAIGGISGVAVRSQGRFGELIGLACLAVAAAAALALGRGEPVTVGDVQLSATSYTSAFLAVGAGACLLLCLVGVTAGGISRIAPAALATFGGFGVALTAADPRVSLMAGAAATAAGTLAAVHRPADPDRDGRLAEIRILALVSGCLLFAAVVVLRPPWAGGDGRAIALAFLGLTLAVAVRSGVVPFHIPAAHLSRNAIPMAPALLLVWIPAGLATLALAWSPLAFQVRSDWMTVGVAAIQIVAVATIILGALGALVHDELEEVACYSIVSDAGFILLALAARTEAAAEPARLWLLVFVAAKTGLVAWVAATSRAFGSSHLGRLRGWLRRTPLLGLCLLLIAAATVGWPGSEVAHARAELVRLGLPSGLGVMTGLAALLSIAYYARLFLIGALAPTKSVRESWSERPRLGFGLGSRAGGTTGRAEASESAVPVPSTGDGGAANEEVPVGRAEESAAGAAEADGGTAAEPAQAVEAAEAAGKPKRKRRSRASAAQETPPTISAELPATESTGSEAGPAGIARTSAEGASESPTAATSAGTEPKVVDLVIPRPRGPRMSLRHRLPLIWRLNRTLEVSLVVLAAASLSLVVAAGSFGTSSAAQFGIPLGTPAHATPTATPAPSLPPTQAPLPTGTPAPSVAPIQSGGAPTGSPGASATPERTSSPPSPVIQ